MNNSKLKNGVQLPKGVDTDRSQSNLEAGVTNSPLGCKPEALSEEHSAWMRQQKSLHNLTEHALRKNQPLIIVNMMHDKAHLLSAEDLTGSLKVEQMCLLALSMRVFPGGLSIEVPSDSNLQEENQDACISNGKGSTVTTGVASTISDSDLPKIVWEVLAPPYLHYPKPGTFSRAECAENPVRFFVIISMQRSGSGWFETLLNSHMNVSSNGEIFSTKDRRDNISSIIRTLDKVYNLDWFTSASKNECSAAIGFKWMLNQV